MPCLTAWLRSATSRLPDGPAEPAVRDTVTRRRHVGVSSIVEIDAISPEAVSRVSTLLTSAAAHRRDGDGQLRLDIVFDEERAHLKIVVLGSVSTSTDIFGLISAVTEEPDT